MARRGQGKFWGRLPKGKSHAGGAREATAGQKVKKREGAQRGVFCWGTQAGGGQKKKTDLKGTKRGGGIGTQAEDLIWGGGGFAGGTKKLPLKGKTRGFPTKRGGGLIIRLPFFQNHP